MVNVKTNPNNKLAKRLAALMQLRCLILAGLAYIVWYACSWASWVSNKEMPSPPNLRFATKRGANQTDRKVKITPLNSDGKLITEEIAVGFSDEPRRNVQADDVGIPQRTDDEAFTTNNDTAANTEVIPPHDDEGSVVFDDAGHLVLTYEKEEVDKNRDFITTTVVTKGPIKALRGSKTLRERLRDRSLETKNRLSQMLHAVVPAKHPRYRHEPSTQTQSGNANRSCDQSDAFVGIPIDAWAPPRGFPKDSIMKWKREYKTAMSRIKDLSVGGNELRESAKAEVQHLKSLRHDLFCEEL